MGGAATAFAVPYHAGSAWPGLVAAFLIGRLLALVHAFLTITMRDKRVVSGVVLTSFGIGLASFVGQRLGPGGTAMVGLEVPSFQRNPILNMLPCISTILVLVLTTALSKYLRATKALGISYIRGEKR